MTEDDSLTFRRIHSDIEMTNKLLFKMMEELTMMRKEIIEIKKEIVKRKE